MAMQSGRQYGALAERLADDLNTTRADLERIDRDVAALTWDDTQEGGVPSNHLADEGSDVYERERLLTVREELGARLAQIEQAQERMAAGSYGVCERCGKQIASERLEALSFATLCIDCQSEVEDRDPGNKATLPLTATESTTDAS